VTKTLAFCYVLITMAVRGFTEESPQKNPKTFFFKFESFF
jgi:hypothetical protein